MGKKRIIKKGGNDNTSSKSRASSRVPKKKIERGILHILATYNNTNIVLTDLLGNAVLSASSGGLGYKGSKKGTPFAAGKAGDVLAEKASAIGVKDIDVIIKGVGSGRESAIRSFIARGINIASIKDKTPIPFNGPKAKKPRRV